MIEMQNARITGTCTKGGIMIRPDWRRVADELPKKYAPCLTVFRRIEDNGEAPGMTVWIIAYWQPRDSNHPYGISGWLSDFGTEGMEYKCVDVLKYRHGGHWRATHWVPFGQADVALPELLEDGNDAPEL